MSLVNIYKVASHGKLIVERYTKEEEPKEGAGKTEDEEEEELIGSGCMRLICRL